MMRGVRDTAAPRSEVLTVQLQGGVTCGEVVVLTSGGWNRDCCREPVAPESEWSVRWGPSLFPIERARYNPSGGFQFLLDIE